MPTMSKEFLTNISNNVMTGENAKQFIFCLLYCFVVYESDSIRVLRFCFEIMVVSVNKTMP